MVARLRAYFLGLGLDVAPPPSTFFAGQVTKNYSIRAIQYRWRYPICPSSCVAEAASLPP